jgi:hypothetical protein
VRVVASNGLLSAGFVNVYPNQGSGPGCRQYAALVRGSAAISGTCGLPWAPKVLAIYSLTFTPSAATVMAQSNLPWS